MYSYQNTGTETWWLGNKTIQQKHCWDWPEYWEVSWRLEESYYLSDSCDKSFANVGAGVKNSEKIRGRVTCFIEALKKPKMFLSLDDAYNYRIFLVFI